MILKKIIVLIGYMGCGKTTVGEKLSTKCRLPFLDLDNEIIKNEKKSIEKIFELEGEIYFRKIEYQVLVNSIKNSDNSIISLGGGTPCYYNSMDLLNKYDYIHTVYLKTSPDVLVNRLFEERTERPMIKTIKSQKSLKDFINKHLFERSIYYHKAKSIIKTDNKSPDKIVNEIRKIILA
ncbi:MAG: shikimate kinase [Flavobacteriaceae bacterium]|nr:shikimate kinase [Flavobacteriaceae bacterium]|tara:strand:+ start:123 stop:659 length:537 start_codon:yes stop_codon:yes gene_type:complete